MKWRITQTKSDAEHIDFMFTILVDYIGLVLTVLSHILSPSPHLPPAIMQTTLISLIEVFSRIRVCFEFQVYMEIPVVLFFVQGSLPLATRYDGKDIDLCYRDLFEYVGFFWKDLLYSFLLWGSLPLAARYDGENIDIFV